jgi:predicted permease
VASSFGSVVAGAVLPVVGVAALGYALGRAKGPDIEPINTVTIYVLLPALVFDTLVTSPFGGRTALSLVAAMTLFTAVMLGLGGASARLVGETGTGRSALVLAAAFPNVGNFGIPVATFAFGEVGRSVAVLFVLVQNVLLYTLGVWLVSWCAGDGGRAALSRVFRLPLGYAVLAAGAVLALGVPLDPEGAFLRTVSMLGDASIPLFLLLLGMQLADTEPADALGRVAPAVVLKLGVAPLVGAAVAALALGADTAPVFVLLSAAPVAVTPLVLHLEFGGGETGLSGASYVGTAVFLTVLGSVPVVALVLALV